MAVVPAAQEFEASLGHNEIFSQNKENMPNIVGRQSLWTFPDRSLIFCKYKGFRNYLVFIVYLPVFHILFFLIYPIPIKIFHFKDVP